VPDGGFGQAEAFLKEMKMIGPMSIYILAVLAANYTATWFIPLPVFGLLSVGTLIFGVTFTQRDRVHRFGRKPVYLMILLAAIGMGLESLLLGVPWRIIVASLVAILASETADTEVYQKLRHLSWLRRVTGSNLVSIPLDSLLFNLIAFAGEFAPAMLAAIIFGEIVSKSVTGFFAALIRAPKGLAAEVVAAS
jgi:uncharacterized PurR-regulated membrane protein YhhQ (DUF165 family)